jgi:heat-inducible transcriptional repressor
MQSIEQLYKQGALATDGTPDAVFVEGAANRVAGEQDRQRLQDMLKTLEERGGGQLLSAALDVKQEAVRVVIGLNDAVPSMSNFVLIGAPARVGHEKSWARSPSSAPRASTINTPSQPFLHRAAVRQSFERF